MKKENTEREVDPKFGQAIRYKRELMKLSLSELSEITGISSSYLNRLEKGDRKAPSYPIMELIARGLNLNLSELLSLASNSENDGELPEIRELLLKNDFKIGDTIVTTEVKELLLKLFEVISSAEWDDEVKFLESGMILQTVDRIKAQI
ncbi:putative transcriptional regulator [Desulfosporosinus acidiphilus SJ4]|uniref:Putative transcriptional regulator n=1 Tax=Desulfosporosinus acidiphilus (strain DSM 22704 / JCM 16185 / SJ4) TaxID=646529 RepID=I4D5H0_DESAJ|nr:helix-turn-helix transcriptional regulator [Desulfosporosinus acidiphilus]AFM41044.1 putative transcriptional regulator [Desulfosporosinus acidiphilus SJ4]